jgi:hypothetical protein
MLALMADQSLMPVRRPRRRALGLALLLVIPLTALNLTCSAPLRVEPLASMDTPLVGDADLELARRYAPVIFHAVHPEQGRQDLPTRVDFDGDLRGDNNWEHMPRFALPPTAYYAVLRTETHLFLTYHLFHPRDWEHVRLGVHLTHENDGENLQVVVDRASGEVVLLFTQAHYCGEAYAVEGAGFGDGEEDLAGVPILLDEDGRPAASGTHAAVYVQARGHGIYGVTADGDEVQIDAEGRATFDCAGLVLRPAALDEPVTEPSLTPDGPVPYALESTTETLWPGLADGSLVGEGGLLDGGLTFTCRWITVDVPRYYEADRFSGPFGPDRGIAPFAVDFDFGEGEVGALFFDPAARYAERLSVPEPWALEYQDYPFVR